MVTKTKVVVVDSDAIFAIYNPDDLLNAQATETFQKLIAQDTANLSNFCFIRSCFTLSRVLPTYSYCKTYRDDEKGSNTNMLLILIL